MLSRTLDSFLPAVYQGIEETNTLINAEEKLMDITRKELLTAFSNTFVLTSDESGVIMFEKMLNIVSNKNTEDLEFRRHRVLNRLSMRPPFTFLFLQQKLNEIIGVDAWKSYIDYDNYTLYIESSATNQNWYYEIEFTINCLKPCNMVFVNIPRTTSYIKLSEQISYTKLNWKYRLGSWRLGKYAFASEDEEGVAKMPEVRSIKPPLLNSTANFVKDEVSKVIVNDEIEITDFKVKKCEDNTVIIEYDVRSDMTNLITNLKLFNNEGSIVSESSVFVPVTNNTVVKHTILVKESE